MNTTDSNQPLPDDLHDLISRYGSLDAFNAFLDEASDISELQHMIDEHGGIGELDRLIGELPDTAG